MESTRGPLRQLASGRLDPRYRRAVLQMTARSVASVVVILAGYVVLPLDGDLDAGAAGLLVVGAIALVAVLSYEVVRIARAEFPRLRLVEALSLSGPLFLVLFAAVYYVIDRNDPGAFSERLSRLDALYFTVTVVSTVGFGDIVPRSDPARVVAMVQMIGNLVFIGLVAKVLLGAVDAAVQRRSSDPGG